MSGLALEGVGIDNMESLPSDKKQKTTAHSVDGAIDFIGGIAGGAACVYVGQPLDTVKVKMQTFPGMYRHALHCFNETLRTQGISRGLYAGTVPSLAANAAENSILFMAYGFCQKGVAMLAGISDPTKLSVLQNATAGGSAAFFSSLALCPTELIKCKLQAMQEMKAMGMLSEAELKIKIGPWSLTRHVLREEGLRGLFRGLIPTFAREMPGYFFFFGGYETSRHLLTPAGKTKEDLGPILTVVCGGIGGMCLWTAVFPADVVKSRAQVQVSNSSKKSTFIRTLITIFRNEGIGALYNGLGPTLLRTFPATGALFLAYETTKKSLHHLYYGTEAKN